MIESSFSHSILTREGNVGIVNGTLKNEKIIMVVWLYRQNTRRRRCDEYGKGERGLSAQQYFWNVNIIGIRLSAGQGQATLGPTQPPIQCIAYQRQILWG
jgi:hypothetical protein